MSQATSKALSILPEHPKRQTRDNQYMSRFLAMLPLEMRQMVYCKYFEGREFVTGRKISVFLRRTRGLLEKEDRSLALPLKCQQM